MVLIVIVRPGPKMVAVRNYHGTPAPPGKTPLCFQTGDFIELLKGDPDTTWWEVAQPFPLHIKLCAALPRKNRIELNHDNLIFINPEKFISLIMYNNNNNNNNNDI